VSATLKANGRFELVDRLGEGSFGVVYEAIDHKRNTTVALKTLRRFEPAALYRFKQEFRSLADADHPNLVSLYELFAEDDEWFFTMEMVHGLPLVDSVRGRLSSILSLSSVSEMQTVELDPVSTPHTETLQVDRLWLAMSQIADALSAIHELGILHRDIKPSNVLLTVEGRAVVLDFGLAAELGGSELEAAQVISGTPRYMSPEQAAGKPLTEASDWYSLGVMLYEALTGVAPFTGPSRELLLEKNLHEAPAPRELVHDIPEELNLLCRDLLRLDPADRPSGADIARRLAAGCSRTSTTTAAPPRQHSAPLMGRESHLAALDDAARIARDTAAVVCIQGRSGMGKSALVRRFLRQARTRDSAVVVLSGRCYEQESVPYKAVDSLIDHLARYLAEQSATADPVPLPPDIVALSRLFPVLREVPAVERLRHTFRAPPDSQELRRRAFAALRDVLAVLARTRPLILYIDDLQWGDVDSAIALTELVRPPDPAPLLMILSYRSEEAGTSALLKTLLPALRVPAAGRALKEIDVGELSFEDARNLARRLLEGFHTAATHADAIARESGGSPFFVQELARRVADSGELLPLDQILQARVAQLPADARELLELVALTGQPLDLDVAASAATTPIDSLAALRQLRVRRLVRTHGAADAIALEAYHDRIREAVVAALPAAATREHHARLATAWEASGQGDPELLLTHHQGAGHPEQAAGYAAQAADRADDALAFDRAARLYRLALELRPVSGAEGRPLRTRLAGALANGGRGLDAAEAYLQAAEGAPPAEQLELEQRAAGQYLGSGYFDQGIRMADRVLRQVGMKLAPTPTHALVSIVLRRAFLRLRGLRFTERPRAEIAPALLTRLETMRQIMSALGMADIIRGLELQLRYQMLALRSGDLEHGTYALVVMVVNSAIVSVKRGAATRADELLARTKNPYLDACKLVALGMTGKLEGRFRDGAENMEKALLALEPLGGPGVSWHRQTARIFLLENLTWLGRWHEAFRLLPDFLQDAQRRGDLYNSSYFQTRISALAALVNDDPNGAEEATRRGLTGWPNTGFQLPHSYAFYTRQQSALYRARPDEGWPVILDTWPKIEKSLMLYTHTIRIEMFHVRARAALASGAANPVFVSEAERWATRLWKTSERWAWGRALATLVRAGSASMRGDRTRALTLAHDARTRFRETDMAMYEAAATRCAGMLTGGEEGRVLLEMGTAAMTAQGIVNPDRITAMLAPGVWR
jgi:tRNA A-37 threonylcarbamoyl transferase component Bud32/tetratricopeptide (TPR) repeat protein